MGTPRVCLDWWSEGWVVEGNECGNASLELRRGGIDLKKGILCLRLTAGAMALCLDPGWREGELQGERVVGEPRETEGDDHGCQEVQAFTQDSGQGATCYI